MKRTPVEPARDFGFGGPRLLGSGFLEYFEERAVEFPQSADAVERRSSNLDRGYVP